MAIVHQSALFSSTPPPVPVLMLPAPPRRLALPAPQIAGYLPAPHQLIPVKRENRVKRVVEAEIVNPLVLIDFHNDFDAWWEEFDRMYPSRTIEELDAEIEAEYPGWIRLKESWA